MADSMCGPSNALQNFQKHSTVDRTLQQDRLISRQSPSQGFRSSPGPNASLLDPEFEAFQAGQLPLDNGFRPQGFSHAPPNLQQPGPSGWASDFQRLQISAPPPQFHQQPFGPQIQQRQNDGGWHEEFARQQGQMPERSIGQMPSQASSPFRPMGGMNITPQYMGGFAGPQAEMSMTQQQHQQPVEAFDEEAFSRAFDEAAKAETDTQQEASHEQDVELGQEILIKESAERLMADSSDLLDQERIGADTIHDPLSDTPEAREQNEDPDALSKTAAELLGKVENNHTLKFQKSQFLSLMRQLKYKEVTVVGDQVVVMSSGEMMGMDQEALKKAITELSKSLKESPIYQHPDLASSKRLLSIRPLFHNLYEIARIGALIDAEMFTEFSFPRDTILEILSSGAFDDFPSIHSLSHVALYNVSPPSSTDIHNASTEIAAIRAANNEIDISSLQRSSGVQPQEAAFEYITSQLSSHPLSRQESLLKVLGYSLLSTPSASTLPIHVQRAQDLLGPEILTVQEICEKRGIFSTPLNVDMFFALVSMAQRDGADSEDFFNVFVGVERDVEFALRYALDSAVQSGDVLGAMDAKRRLKCLMVERERNKLPGEEVWGKE